jgi:hypothetical protein
MAKQRKSTVGWGACKAAMRDWPIAGVIALVQELYELSDDNRRFLNARLVAAASAQTVFEIKKRLKGMLSKSAVWNGRFRHIDIKRVIDQFEKATDDPVSVAELLLTDLEEGFTTFSKVGDFEELVDHLYATLNRLDKCLEKLSGASLGPLIKWLDRIAQAWGAEFGYGISDELTGMAADWQERISKIPPAA